MPPCAVITSPKSPPQETPPLLPKTMPSLPIFGAPNLNDNDEKEIMLSEVVRDRFSTKETYFY